MGRGVRTPLMSSKHCPHGNSRTRSIMQRSHRWLLTTGLLLSRRHGDGSEALPSRLRGPEERGLLMTSPPHRPPSQCGRPASVEGTGLCCRLQSSLQQTSWGPVGVEGHTSPFIEAILEVHMGNMSNDASFISAFLPILSGRCTIDKGSP